MRPATPILVATVVVAILLAGGCGESRVADETGVISDIDSKAGVLVQPEDECGIWVSPGENTEVAYASGEDASWDDLASGMRVEVWLDTDVAASCPALAGAGKVVIKD